MKRNRMRAYERAQNLIHHSGSPINLRDGLSALADAYLALLDELYSAQDRLHDYEEDQEPV